MKESIRKLLFVVGAYYFLQGMGGNPGLHDQALNRYLTETLGYTGKQLGNISLWLTLPWMIKPAYGLFADFLPIKGYHIKSYFVLASTLATTAYLGVAYFGYTSSGLRNLLIISAVGIAFTDVLCDKLMVIKGQAFSAADRLQSSQWFANGVAGILIALAGGYIAARMPVQKAVWFSLIFVLPVIPITLFFWKEDRIRSRREESANAWKGVLAAWRSRPLWGCAIFLLLYNLSPNLGRTLYLYEDRALHFSQELIGYINAVGSIGFVLGTIVFYAICKLCSEKWLLRGIIITGVASTLAFVFFKTPATALAIMFAAQLVGAFAFLGTLTLAARVCPKNAEATVFALLMSISNLGTGLGNKAGGWLYDETGYTWLVIISATFTACIWFFLPLVRRKNASS